MKLSKVKQIRIASAYVQGRGHLIKNIPCQDKVFSINENSFSIIALADGAGSCKYSDKGAEIVTKKVSQIFKTNFNKLNRQEIEKLQKYIISNLIIELNKYSKVNNISVNELASTLLFVAIKKEYYIVGHLGDGVIGYKDKENNINVLSHPHNGEYSNSTFFVTSKNAHNFLRIYKGKIDNIEGFILMSDGSEESLYDKKNRFLSSANLQMINWLDNNSSKQVSKALNNNLNNYIKKRTFDDCSIGILKIVETNLQVLIDLDLILQKEILGSNSAVYVRNDIKIINALIIHNLKSVKEISSFSMLTKRTVRKHLRKLKQKKIIRLNIK